MRFLPQNIALFALLFLQPFGSQGKIFATCKDSPPVCRVQEIVELVNSSSYMTMKDFFAKNVSPRFISASYPLDAMTNDWMYFQDHSRGLIFRRIKEKSATKATVILQERLTEQMVIFTVEVESLSPFLITALSTMPFKDEKEKKYEEKISQKTLIRELDHYVKKLRAAEAFSGSVLLAYKGKPIYKKVMGLASRDYFVANKIDTKFNLGSMNKMFTGVAIAQLVENGKLSFDDTLAKYFPEIPNRQDSKKICIKHLLTHTSGMGNYFNEKFFDSSRALFHNINNMMKLIDDKNVAFAPGSKWQYSNTGFLLLGAIIEKVTGQSYFDYVREKIFEPAGMKNTDSYQLDQVNHNLAVGYFKEFSSTGVIFKNNLFEHVVRGGPAGGGYSTVEDLLKFANALTAFKFVSPEVTKIILTAKPELHSFEYGYGFGVVSNPPVVGHDGGFPGIEGWLQIYQESGYTFIGLGNSDGGLQPIHLKVRELMEKL